MVSCSLFDGIASELAQKRKKPRGLGVYGACQIGLTLTAIEPRRGYMNMIRNFPAMMRSF